MCALALGAVLSVPALATPPNFVEIRDEPFGLSATDFYLLRTTTDNLGLYAASRIEVFLVAVDLETSEEQYWPVYRSLQAHDDGDTRNRITVTTDPIDDLAAPFAILGQNDGVPWNSLWFPMRLNGDLVASPQASIYFVEQVADPLPQLDQSAPDAGHTAADTFIIKQIRGPSLRLERSVLGARLAATSAALTAQISNYPRLSQIPTRTVFARRVIDEKTCSPERLWQPVSHFNDRVVAAVQFTCDEGEFEGVSSVIQLFSAIKSAGQDTGQNTGQSAGGQ